METELLSFDVPDVALAWEVLAGVTTAQLAPERRAEVQAAVQAVMWREPERPRQVRNLTHVISGQR